MKLFAISDPHLSFAANKPMDVFGPRWTEHTTKLERRWRETVGPEDIVCVAGDVSWAMRLPEAAVDLQWLARLPGRKVFVKGNHDYWWSSLKKIGDAAGAGMFFVQNNAVLIDGVAFAGSRLWDYPFVRWPGAVAVGEGPADARGGSPAEPAAEGGHGEVDAEKVRANERNRLQTSLSQLPSEARLRVCLTHFPPVSREPQTNELTCMITAAQVDLCVYGHLHALDPAQPMPGADCTLDGTRYVLTSADWLDFQPLLLAEL